MPDKLPESGKPPKDGLSSFACELFVENLHKSHWFWTELLGFEIAYQRVDEKFMYLAHPDGAQIMLSEKGKSSDSDRHATSPSSNGNSDQHSNQRCDVMLQLTVKQLAQVEQALNLSNWPLTEKPREVWRQWGDRLGGRLELRTRDPDGYLILLAEFIGEKPIVE